MYTPKRLKMNEQSEQHGFIEEFGFGLIVSKSLNGTHIPFVLHRNEGEKGVLYAHCAKANPHWQELDQSEVLVVFSGPHSYISPSWYAQPPGVPTWNYAAVHAYGVVTMLNSDETLTVVEEVVEQYEPQLLEKRDIITNDYRDKMLAAIVGFKVEITRIEGKQKLGQLRSKEDQAGVFDALSTSSGLDQQALARYMVKTGLGLGRD